MLTPQLMSFSISFAALLALRARIAAAGAACAQDFSIEMVVEKLEALYRSVARNERSQDA